MRTAILMNPVIKIEGGEQEYGMNVYVSVLRLLAEKKDNPQNTTESVGSRKTNNTTRALRLYETFCLRECPHD